MQEGQYVQAQRGDQMAGVTLQPRGWGARELDQERSEPLEDVGLVLRLGGGGRGGTAGAGAGAGGGRAKGGAQDASA